MRRIDRPAIATASRVVATLTAPQARRELTRVASLVADAGPRTQLLLDQRFDFNFHEHGRVDQRANLDHAGSRANFPEILAVDPSDRFPVALDVHDVHAGADDVRELRA